MAVTTTFRPGPRIRPDVRTWQSARGPTLRAVRPAFTLLELILVLALLGLLASMTAISLSGWQSKAQLNEGIDRFQTAVALLRADAANQGRRLRLAFEQGEDERWQPVTLWERDPLGAPGEFTPYEGASVKTYLPGSLVRVVRCRLMGSSAAQVLVGADAGMAEQACVPVTFYPDGSCDAAEIHLVSADPDDTRVAVVRVSGLTGRTDCVTYSAEQYEELP